MEEVVKKIANQAIKTGKQIKQNEISKEAQAERQFLTGLLIEQTEELTKKAQQRKQERANEEFELRSGVKISIQKIQDFVTANTQPYEPKFPNDIPFFKEMFRLLSWTDKNPNDFTKPAVVGSFINEIIYQRFHRDVLPALQVMAMPGGVRMHKFFQFLTPEGQTKLEEYRDDAIRVMKTCTSWYEFRLKYAKEFNLPVQLKLRNDL
jgi:hypothetical protein